MTELKGGIIGSTATADLNRLTTGTFRASAINNFETYSATSFNFGFGFGNIGFNSNTGSTTSNGTGISIPGFGTFTFTFPSYFYASGGQASVSNSAISPASVIIGSGEAASYAALGALSRDTSTSSVLTRQFTEARRASVIVAPDKITRSIRASNRAEAP